VELVVEGLDEVDVGQVDVCVLGNAEPLSLECRSKAAQVSLGPSDPYLDSLSSD